MSFSKSLYPLLLSSTQEDRKTSRLDETNFDWDVKHQKKQTKLKQTFDAKQRTHTMISWSDKFRNVLHTTCFNGCYNGTTCLISP